MDITKTYLDYLSTNTESSNLSGASSNSKSGLNVGLAFETHLNERKSSYEYDAKKDVDKGNNESQFYERKTQKNANSNSNVDRSRNVVEPKADNVSKETKTKEKTDNVSQDKNADNTQLNEKLTAEIAKTLDVPVEDIQNILAELGIMAADLLKPENMNAFLMKLNNFTDQAQLLTVDVSEILKAVNEAVENITSQLSPEALKNQAQNTEVAVTAAQVPEKVHIEATKNNENTNAASNQLFTNNSEDEATDINTAAENTTEEAAVDKK